MTARYARIRLGACVMQDHQFPTWPISTGHEGVVFSVTKATTTYKCIADGYGRRAGSSYGNGAVFVRLKDLRWCMSNGEALTQRSTFERETTDDDTGKTETDTTLHRSAVRRNRAANATGR